MFKENILIRDAILVPELGDAFPAVQSLDTNGK